MSAALIIGKKEEIMKIIKNQRILGERLLPDLQPQNTTNFPNAEYESWISTTGKLLERNFSNQSLSNSFLLKASILDFKISSLDKYKQLESAISFLKNLEADLSKGLHNPIENPIKSANNEINEETAKIIIRRILNIFISTSMLCTKKKYMVTEKLNKRI
ncbi:MAG: hypothetical protein WA118_11645 [Carboxydocellales bacterium]